MDVSLRKDNVVTVEIKLPQNDSERLDQLEMKVKAMSEMIFQMQTGHAEVAVDNVVDDVDTYINTNKDGIPVGSNYLGFMQEGELPYVLHVDFNGDYSIAGRPFETLGEAAKSVNNTVENEWTFWHNLSGKTLEEIRVC